MHESPSFAPQTADHNIPVFEAAVVPFPVESVRPCENANVTLGPDAALKTVHDSSGKEYTVVANITPASTINSYAELDRQRGKGTYIAFDPARPKQVSFLDYTENGANIVNVKKQKIDANRVDPVTLQTATPDLAPRVSFSAADKKAGTPAVVHIGGTPRFGGGASPESPVLNVQAAKDALSISSGPVIAEKREANTKRQDMRLKQFLAGTALLGIATYGIAGSGGALDSALDKKSDAGTVVEQMNGYVNPGDADEATSRVAQVMRNLDNHNDGAILQAAEEYRAKHTADLLSDKQVEDYKERVDEADTAAEVAQITDEFMQFSGKHAELLTEADVQPNLTIEGDSSSHSIASYDDHYVRTGLIKGAAKALITDYSKLPSGFIKDLPFTKVQFGTKADMNTGGLYAGIGDNDEKAIQIAVDAATILQAKIGSTRGIAAHELGHADDPNVEAYTGENNRDITVDERIDQISNYVTDTPTDVSDYAVTGGSKERTAENFGNMVSDDGLAHPDQTRRFGSDRNAQVLAQYVQIEREYPGFTADKVVRDGMLNDGKYKPWPKRILRSILGIAK